MDKLAKYYLEDRILERPTFIIDHPEVMSPLAKDHRTKPCVTERFELFCVEKNYAMRTQSSMIQMYRGRDFKIQAEDKSMGDNEAHQIDEDFLSALNHGLPPTAGGEWE